MSNNKSQSKIIFAILSLSFINMIVSATTPAIQVISEAFPTVPFTSIMLVSTLPSLVSVPSSILGGAITGKVLNYKTVLYISLLLMTIGGVSPYWMTNWTMILVAMTVFGIGMGLLMPLIGALIFNLIAPDKVASIMGLYGVMGFVGGMLFTVLGGILASISWNLPFLLNVIPLFVLVIVVLFLPEPERQEAVSSETDVSKTSRSMPAIVWIWTAVMTIFSILQYPSLMNISTIFKQMGLSSAMAGTAVTVMTIGGMVTGIAFGKIFGSIGYKCLPVGFAIIACSQILMATGMTFLTFVIAEFLLGIGSFFVNNSIMMAVGGAVSSDKTPMAMSLVNAGMSLGGFLSAFMYAGLMGVLEITSMRFQYWSGLVSFGVLTIITFFIYFMKKNSVPDPNDQAQF
ncbi:MFS transporter [Enterococcus sp. DIV0756]|uniref:MFS transporter n=1 Tax=Enterococcus sp. DIV0756 TaxID=2774636 RepID=UPI003F29A224